jgi:hypothetical protein
LPFGRALAVEVRDIPSVLLLVNINQVLSSPVEKNALSSLSVLLLYSPERPW